MVKRELPKYCYRLGRKGYIYYRHGGVLHRMPNDPTSTEFAQEYAKLRSGRNLPPATRNFKKLIAHYMQSQKWERLAENTRKSYRQSFRYLEDRIGSYDPKSMQRVHVISMRDALAHKPTTANRRVGALSVLYEHGIDIGWLTQNPAKSVGNLEGKRDPRHPWPQDLIDKARETATGETLVLFEMLLGTGQRINDVLAMQWGHIEADGIWLIPTKTARKKKRLYIPFTTRLSAVLADTPKRSLHIVTLPDGKPMAYQTAWKRIMDLRKAIGAEQYDIHSLRHAAASEIAAIPGMTLEHVAAITGHSGSEMAKHYSQSTWQKARAQEAQKGRK